MQKHISKICSYIQKTTPNPINALKITIYNTKHTSNTKIYFKKYNCFETSNNFKQIKPLLYYILNFHSSYFIYLVYFVYFAYWNLNFQLILGLFIFDCFCQYIRSVRWGWGLPSYIIVYIYDIKFILNLYLY